MSFKEQLGLTDLLQARANRHLRRRTDTAAAVQFCSNYEIAGQLVILWFTNPHETGWWVVTSPNLTTSYERKTLRGGRHEAIARHQHQMLRRVHDEFEKLQYEPQDDDGYDAFVSYASEDREQIVRPLVAHLLNSGLRVWYDELALKPGDSLRETLDKGLAAARCGVVILSPSFFKKRWPQQELSALFSRQAEGQPVILPVWYHVNKTDLISLSPLLADIIGINATDVPIETIAEQLARAIIRVGTVRS